MVLELEEVIPPIQMLERWKQPQPFGDGPMNDLQARKLHERNEADADALLRDVAENGDLFLIADDTCKGGVHYNKATKTAYMHPATLREVQRLASESGQFRFAQKKEGLHIYFPLPDVNEQTDEQKLAA